MGAMAAGWTTRPLTPGLVPVVEALSLAPGQLVTMDEIEAARLRIGSPTAAKVLATRLRNRGWLLPTGRRSVYEYAPDASVDPFRRRDPLVSLRAALVRRPDLASGLTFRSAAWLHGFTDRPPTRPEVAAPTKVKAVSLAAIVRAFVFEPQLPVVVVDGLPVLSTESLLVHLAAKPMDVRHWSTTLGWLPRAAAAADADRLRAELDRRTRPVVVRLGYLLSGVRPDLAGTFREAIGARVPFGSHGRFRRTDRQWHVVDSLLPISPSLLDPVGPRGG